MEYRANENRFAIYRIIFALKRAVTLRLSKGERKGMLRVPQRDSALFLL
jgi:hypothetical protein